MSFIVQLAPEHTCI